MSSIVLTGLVPLLVLAGSVCTASVELVVQGNPPPALAFGVSELRSALQSKVVSAGAAGTHRVTLRVQGGAGPWKPTAAKPSLPAEAESYRIIADGSSIAVEGRDAVGAMYGALDLAEQIRLSGAADPLADVRPVSKAPYLAVRGVNMFLTSQGFDESDSWYWSDSYWQQFLDMLARDRYNFLDFHAVWDVTRAFPNVLPFVVSLPEYPQVGVGPERAAKNLARLRQIVRMAADRGIRVGVMNYSSAAFVGPWPMSKFLETPIGSVGHKVQYLEGAKIADYTRKAVEAFLKGVPELWMFGFRIGESGQEEGFYKTTYLAALKEAPKGLNLYARTWGAIPENVRDVARATDHHFFIEPKFNGEQLGLPYQAVTGGRLYPPSGSYENYTNYPRDYDIIWQVRANGTHRVFNWGWPEYARRLAQSCRFGGGVGFSMEPMNCYNPQVDYRHNNSAVRHPCEWAFEQQWMWYQVWGRTGYDPSVSDSVFGAEFDRRFGRDAGPSVYRAVVESSRIVPFVYSYHCEGLDHQNQAVELETGDRDSFDRTVSGRFEDYGTLDRTAMDSPFTYVVSRLRGEVTGKMSPFEAADYLDKAASSARSAFARAASASPRSAAEFDCVKMDVEALAAFASYFADRIRSATHLQFYQQSLHHPELVQAKRYMDRAAAEWDGLCDITDRHFGYIPDTIRTMQYKFNWRDERKFMQPAIDKLDRLEKEYPLGLAWPVRDSWIAGHVPPVRVEPGRALELSVTCADDYANTRAWVAYRTSTKTPWAWIEMSRDKNLARVWNAAIPVDVLKPGQLEYYFELRNPYYGYGGTLDARPPYTLPVSSDTGRPTIKHTPPARAVHGDSVVLAAEVSDPSGIRSVRVYYKAMPAYAGWIALPMRSAGGGRYTAAVPLTSEGILYYFEAVDNANNGANYPDFTKQTPYFVIGAWDASKNP